jgi:hypothetical protein
MRNKLMAENKLRQLTTGGAAPRCNDCKLAAAANEEQSPSLPCAQRTFIGRTGHVRSKNIVDIRLTHVRHTARMPLMLLAHMLR